MDRLQAGQSLKKGESLQSANGQYTLILQEDGNLVIYTQGRATWDSKTAGKAVSHAILQSDGNFVIYGYPNAIFDTGTTGWINPFLVMQDDGNLVLYGWKAAWDSNHHRMQRNIVVSR
jgi:hypothetical protein